MRSVCRKSVLDNGVRVVTEWIPHVRSVSLGVWVEAGPQNEERSKSGISHFLEHMVFKGTQKRDTLAIANSLESLGGQLDAFTGRDITCFFAWCLDEHLPVVVDVLSDMLANSLFVGEEVAKEKRVVIQEIRSVQDTPDDLIHDEFARSIWEPHPVGSPVLGTEETVGRLSRADLLDYMRDFYKAGNVVISAAGNVDHERLVDDVQRSFRFNSGYQPSKEELLPLSSRRIKYVEKNASHTHLCLGTRGYSYPDPRRHSLLVANAVLGGGMSSRLFQNIREKSGLTYSVYSYLEFLGNTGLFAAYLACDCSQTLKSIELVSKELASLKREPLSEEELVSAKSQLRGNLILSLENTTNRMNRIARQEIYLGHFQSVDETISTVESVSCEDVLEVCQSLFDKERLHLVMLGPGEIDGGRTEDLLDRWLG